MLDLIIRGGQVVTPWGVSEWDVAVQGEKIVAVAAYWYPHRRSGTGDRRHRQNRGTWGVEPHAHVSAPIMGHGDLKTAPPDQVSRAALFGGTTTIGLRNPVSRHRHQPSNPRANCVWQGNSYSDYSHHLMLLGEIPPNILAQLGDAVADGFPTFKIFTTNIRPPATTGEPRMVRMGHLHDLMEQVQRLDAMLLVHSRGRRYGPAHVP